jgi:hypothetical protein
MPRVVDTWGTKRNAGAGIEVGDCVEVFWPRCEDNQMVYHCFSLRTGAGIKLPWSAFLPVGTREMCECLVQKCRCVYEDDERADISREMHLPDGRRFCC